VFFLFLYSYFLFIIKPAFVLHGPGPKLEESDQGGDRVPDPHVRRPGCHLHHDNHQTRGP